MKIERNVSKKYEFSDIIGVYIEQKLKWILEGIITRDVCNKLFCSDVKRIKAVLLLWKIINNISIKYNISIDKRKLIPNKYMNKILSIYQHVIEKHEYILKYLSKGFSDTCSNIRCSYSIRNRNNECRYNNGLHYIFDEIHDNIIHYNDPVNYKKIKHNKFITEINNAKVYDYGRIVDYYGYQSDILRGMDRISAKYGSLKEEMLWNDIERIPNPDWEAYYMKATRLFHSLKAIKAKTDVIPTIKSDILGGTRIDIPHILAIILYTDNDVMCYKFRKSLRRYDDNGELITDSKKSMYNPNEFAIWGKLLYEAVKIYGENIDTRNEYYHGLNRTFIFRALIMEINLPLSTTTQIDVANNFMGTNSGMIITFKPSPNNNVRCLSCKCFSKFANENEVLFFQHNFSVYDIYLDRPRMNEMSINNLTKSYALLNCILKGKYFNSFNTNVDDDNILAMSNQSELIRFIECIINGNEHHMNYYFEYFRLCLFTLTKNDIISINNDYVLTHIKNKSLNTQLVSLLFDITDETNTLKPGILIKHLSTKDLGWIIYTTSSNSIRFTKNLMQPLTCDLTYLCTLNENDITLSYSLSIFKARNGMYDMCYLYVNGTGSSVHKNFGWIYADFYITCPEVDWYFTSSIYGSIGAYMLLPVFSIKDTYKSYTFEISLNLKALGYIDPYFIYDFMYGMY